MEEDLKSDMQPIVKDFVYEKITYRKLSVDGENYVQWRKIVEVHVKGRGKKHYLTEPPPEQMTDE